LMTFSSHGRFSSNERISRLGVELVPHLPWKSVWMIRAWETSRVNKLDRVSSLCARVRRAGVPRVSLAFAFAGALAFVAAGCAVRRKPRRGTSRNRPSPHPRRTRRHRRR